jgi:hypothetical protein
MITIYAQQHVVELGAKLVIWISLILEDLAEYYLGFGLLETKTAFLLEFYNYQFDYFGQEG